MRSLRDSPTDKACVILELTLRETYATPVLLLLVLLLKSLLCMPDIFDFYLGYAMLR